MKRERLYTYLIGILALAFFSGGAYIFIDMSLKAKTLDFSWASNILLGLSGITVLFLNHFHKLAKDKEADLFSD